MQKLRIPFLNHVLLSLKNYAEAQGVAYRTQKGDQWHRIKNSVAVRDRITHPKKFSALAITKEEVADIEFSPHWFLTNSLPFFARKGTNSHHRPGGPNHVLPATGSLPPYRSLTSPCSQKALPRRQPASC